MTDQLRVGIVGAQRGTSLIPGFRAQGAEVTSLCARNEDFLNSQADRFGVAERITNYQALLESEIDVVVVATPMHLHVPHTLQALKAGKHVISEVTGAVSVEQCRDLVDGVEAARDAGASYMLGENACFSPKNILIKNLVDAGLFGDIYYAEGEYIHDIKPIHYSEDGGPTWRTVWQVGVNGCTYGTHSLGPILDWFNERVASVMCIGSGIHTSPENKAEDTTTMLCKLDSGALVKIRVDMLSNRPHGSGYSSLQGTSGCYEGPRALGDQDKIWLERFGSDSTTRETIDTDPYQWRPLSDLEGEYLPACWTEVPDNVHGPDYGAGEYHMIGEFLQAIREERDPAIDVYRAVDMTLPGLLSQVSIERGGEPISVPNFRAGNWS